jgi:hypothetical protein
VAIDSTHIQASACRDRIDSEQALRDMRARLRRQVRTWQQAADRDDIEPGGPIGVLEDKLAELPQRLERLQKSGLKKLSRTDQDARFLRQRGGHFVLGYTAEIAVSDDHLIVAQRGTQNAADNHSLLPMIDQTRQRCGGPPARCWPTAASFPLPTSNRWNSRISTDTCPTPTSPGPQPRHSMPLQGMRPSSPEDAPKTRQRHRKSRLRQTKSYRRTRLRSA